MLLDRVRARIDALTAEAREIEARWKAQSEAALALLRARGAATVEGDQVDVVEPAPVDTLRELERALAVLQHDTPLVFPEVNEVIVATIVSDWTGIPAGRMVTDEVAAVLALPATLEKRVIGQQAALRQICERVQTARAGLTDPNKPIGVFLLAGPSGVGKTETALALAEALYGGEQNLITINMSEYQEAHTVSGLKGAPPGYVGYGEGGVLTEAVRRRPYSVVLLDEVEKAHPDIHEIFFQVFDKGYMEDGDGRYIDFRNTTILLTTNVGSELIMTMCRDPSSCPIPRPCEGLAPAAVESVPAGPPRTADDDPVLSPVDTKIPRYRPFAVGRIARRINERHKIPFTYYDDVVKLIASRCSEPESGGRMIDAILTNTMLPAISGAFLERMLEGDEVTRVQVGAANGEFSYSLD